MFRVIFLQLAVTLVSALLAGLFFGGHGALSAALGGLACVVPNGLFALRLYRAQSRSGASFAVSFFLGEFIKIVATVGLLGFIGMIYADLHWPSMLIGLVLALQAVFLAFWNKS